MTAVDHAHNFALPDGSARRTPSKQTVRLLLYLQLLLLDMVAVSVGCMVASHLGGRDWVTPSGINLGFMIVPVYAFFAANERAYSLSTLTSLSSSLRRSFIALAITVLFVLLSGFFMSTTPVASRRSVLFGLTTTTLLLLLSRVGFHYLVSRHKSKGLVDELLVVDGVAFPALQGIARINAADAHIRPDLRDPVMINRLADCLKGVDRVVVACPPERQHAWALLLKGSNIRGEILMPQANPVGAIGLNRFGSAETLVVSRGPLSLRSRAQKRALDLLVTVPALIAISPLLLAVALAIKLESKGPVFFRQNRIGRSNSVFSILKFRSMRTELCDAAGGRSASRDDDRITRVGRIIRSTSIDELPQLLNVLRGDMSLVGPRPHALGSLAGDQLFWEVNEQYWVRHALKPGITGLAQIRGHRGATLQREDLEKRLQSDLEYVNDWSLWRDILILIATFKVIRHQNAF